ncbi:conjugal transfer protein [Streptomyces sp. R302]|uniref:conjugal transfer protein n=1 Tax=unclassified Streptomyces TaxID=2593676 RepID=UPI00145E39B6|nr:conjugal transfer protein [Streptomyces sp. R301]NML80638.1 conjugal transfer protein [Streptomyces sp. R302]
MPEQTGAARAHAQGEEAGLPAEAGGWELGSLGASANVVTVLRRSAWVLLLAGPVLGAWALLAGPEAVRAEVASERPAAVVVDSSGPGGFAELFVTAYLEAGEGQTGDAVAAFMPGAGPAMLAGGGGGQVVEQAAAVRVRAVSAGYWAVTVAARVRPAEPPAKPNRSEAEAEATVGLRYFRVPVRSGASGELAAVALPAEVGALPAGQAPELGYGKAAEPSTADPGVRTIQGFFTSYLAGGGEVDRYMPPGSRLTPITPAPYASARVERVAEYGTNAPGATFPESAGIPDGTRRRLLVDVTAAERGGAKRPLTYAVALKSRDGRWEVEAVEAAPLLAAGSGATDERSK